MPRRSREEAAQTRRDIVETAVTVASTDGLEGLTIGRLADRVGMSKSGVLGHFGDKETLQLAALEQAIARFTSEVWDRVAGEEPGIARLRAAAEAWVAYLERGVFPGGCFFAAATAEMDDRPGPVRDRLAEAMRQWLGALAADARRAQRAGDLSGDLSPEQIAFEMNGAILAANYAYRLHEDPSAFGHARSVMRRLLG